MSQSPRHRLIHSPLPLIVAMLALAGCAVGPDFKTPAPPQAAGYTAQPLPAATAAAEDPAGAAQRLVVGQAVPAQWWTLLHSQAVTGLVGEAIKSSPDLAGAQAALKAARETYLAQRGALLPTVDAGYNVTRQKTSDALSPTLSSNTNLFTLHTAQVTVGYVPDVFGGVRRQTESVKAQAQVQRFQTEAAYLTLTSSVAAAAIQQASLRDQVAATQAIIESASQVLKTLHAQLDQGQVARGDVVAQETALAQARQALPPLEKQLAQQNDLIAQLTGHAPGDPLPQASLEDMTLPPDLPVSLPAQLVAQRPDVRQAEENLHAASAQVGVAIAARLPSLDLTAAAGGSSSALQTLFSNGNGFLALTGGVAQPVFEGGALLHRQRAAEAQLDQAKAQYRSTVLSALQNVADTLQALQVDARALQAAVQAQHSADESLRIATAQLNLGQTSGVAALIAQQAHQQAAIALVQARAARYADTVALFQALGGGWWNRDNPS
jgi:NodT family efflux transporter outer membrane factor (OMF) lipoprotein